VGGGCRRGVLLWGAAVGGEGIAAIRGPGFRLNTNDQTQSVIGHPTPSQSSDTPSQSVAPHPDSVTTPEGVGPVNAGGILGLGFKPLIGWTRPATGSVAPVDAPDFRGRRGASPAQFWRRPQRLVGGHRRLLDLGNTRAAISHGHQAVSCLKSKQQTMD